MLASWDRSWANPRRVAIGSPSHYAQEHGLTLDFYTESSKRAAAHLISLKGESQHAKSLRLTSYSHLAQCTIPLPRISDPWLDSELSSQYFQQLFPNLDGPYHQELQISEPRHLEAKQSRCEIPILRSDNNLDLLGLVRDVCSRRAVPLIETSIPLTESDASGDEGVWFPCWSDQLSKHFDNHLTKETTQDSEDLQLSEDSDLYCASNIRKPDREDICDLIDTEFAVYKKTRSSRGILSSPLLPSQFSYDVFIPDGDVCVIPCFSDTTALLDRDIKQVESHLMAERDGEDTLHSELQTPPESSPVFPVPQKEGPRISDLKIEVPLTDPIVRCHGGLKDLMLQDALGSVTSLCAETSLTVAEVENRSGKAPFLTGEIAIQAQKAYEKTCWKVEQERLSDPCSSRRVPVPVMDFTIPEPGWKKLAHSSTFHFKSFGLFAREIVGKQVKGNVREERKLRWRPFYGSSGKVSLTEQIIVDSKESEVLRDIPGSSEANEMKLKCILARRTRRFLSGPIDGIEERLLSPVDKQMRLPSTSPRPYPANVKRIQQSPHREGFSSKKQRNENKEIGSGGLGLLDGGGSDGVGGLLTSYLQIRAPEKALLAKSTQFSGRVGAVSTDAFPGFQNHIQPPWESQEPTTKLQQLPTMCPDFDPRGTGSTYIVSAALVRPVVRQLDQLCPLASLYDRSYGSHTKYIGASGIRGRWPRLAHEADIALSSSTGIIATSLTQLRQKSLAGSRQTTLYQKMRRVAAIYEKLVVLISAPSAMWTSDDTRSYTDFVAFVNTLDSSIDTILMGDDNDECLAKWIICLMNEYRYEGRRNEHFLVQDETSWETFFRLGGMNVYAAQVLVGALKTAHGSQGVSRLLAMAPDERVTAFGGTIGTRRPLDSFSSWVDQERV